MTLNLAPGAVILAASVPFEGAAQGGYDAAEPIDPAYGAYQDFGHGHWRNALITGESLSDVAITGGGLINGEGLSRDWHDEGGRPGSRKPGTADKAIALKLCRNVLIRDVRIVRGGWFALLATGVDTLTIDNVVVDTNRDGFDLDGCRNVRVTGCTVNSPYDDGICPKSSYALGHPQPTQDVTISDCFLTGGYEVGSVVAGTWKAMPPGFDGVGRIKCGTESNGGFRNIAITNCVFERSRGIALETVDGAVCEDIAIANITLRGCGGSPLFLRLGRRLRGPAGTAPGALRRVSVSNLSSSGAGTSPSTIAGVAGFPVEDVTLSDVRLHQVGGLAAPPASYAPAAAEAAYPEPGMFGPLPATGVWARHVRDLQLRHLEVETAAPDARPALWLEAAQDVDVFDLRHPSSAPAYALRDVMRFRAWGARDLPDLRRAHAAAETV